MCKIETCKCCEEVPLLGRIVELGFAIVVKCKTTNNISTLASFISVSFWSARFQRNVCIALNHRSHKENYKSAQAKVSTRGLLFLSKVDLSTAKFRQKNCITLLHTRRNGVPISGPTTRANRYDNSRINLQHKIRKNQLWNNPYRPKTSDRAQSVGFEFSNTSPFPCISLNSHQGTSYFGDILQNPTSPNTPKTQENRP